MILLGVNLPDRRLIKIALTAFHGISHSTSRLICAKMHFHDRMAVQDLTEPQINALNNLLSSPAAYMSQHPTVSPTASSSSSSSSRAHWEHSRLENLVIESDLRKQVNADIGHHRSVGSYRGREHAMGLPVRGQRTKTNAKTARKLNRVERRTFSTLSASTSYTSRSTSRPSDLHPSSTRYGIDFMTTNDKGNV